MLPIRVRGDERRRSLGADLLPVLGADAQRWVEGLQAGFLPDREDCQGEARMIYILNGGMCVRIRTKKRKSF